MSSPYGIWYDVSRAKVWNKSAKQITIRWWTMRFEGIFNYIPTDELDSDVPVLSTNYDDYGEGKVVGDKYYKYSGLM